MKFGKKIFVVLLLLITCFSTIVNAASSAPSKFTISASKTKMLYGSKILGNGSTLNFTYKVNNDGQIVYCTEIHDGMTSSTETYTLTKEASADLAYVLANGYPNKSITGNNDTDYYITGLAIWYLLAPNDSTFTNFNLSAGTYKGKSSDVVKKINELVTGAKKASYVTPTLKLNNPSTKLTLSSDGKYYVSQAMSVSTTGSVGKYTVSLSNAPSGTLVVNKNGSAQTSFATNETFIVKVPVANISGTKLSLNVKVTATGNINKAYIYGPTNSKHQSLATMYPEKFDLSGNTTLGVTREGSVSISKQDITSKKELAGAHLVVKNESGKVIDEWVSSDKPHKISGLEPGKTYLLTETIAPEGYVLSKETIKFTVNEDGTVKTVVMYNEPKKVLKVKISKQDITNDKELPGAHLVVKDKSGKVIDEWVSSDKPHEIVGLDANKTYYLTETIAPEGYELSKETIEFKVSEDGKVETVVMYNEPKKVIKVTISKLDITNDKELPGAHLVVKDESGKVVDEWVSSDKPHEIEGLEPGKTYVLTETIAPEGYVLSEESIKFTVDKDGKVTHVVMYNSPKEVVKVIISKQDITNGEELPGAHLVVKDKDGKVIDEWVSSDKAHEIEGLEPGAKYYLTETIAPDGYILNEETVEFIVDKDGNVTKVVMYNAPSEVVVEVPKTSSFKTITYSLIGILIIGLGSLMIIKNVKKNEI